MPQNGVHAMAGILARRWMYIEFALFILFAIVFFNIGGEGMQYTVFGALYLLSTIIAIVMTIRMKKTIETRS